MLVQKLFKELRSDLGKIKRKEITPITNNLFPVPDCANVLAVIENIQLKKLYVMIKGREEDSLDRLVSIQEAIKQANDEVEKQNLRNRIEEEKLECSREIRLMKEILRFIIEADGDTKIPENFDVYEGWAVV